MCGGGGQAGDPPRQAGTGLTLVMTGAGHSEVLLRQRAAYTHLPCPAHHTHLYSGLAARHRLQSPRPKEQL